jgi:hypothetical protein
MKSLTPSTNAYLLDAGIETLHQQSMEWLDDIAFWRDEAAFLYALEISKTSKEVPVKAKGKLDKINDELIKMSAGELDSLYEKVEAHEKFLDQLISSKREDEASYREKHKQIGDEIIKFGLRFREVKKGMFEVVKLTKTDLVVEVPSGKKH